MYEQNIYCCGKGTLLKQKTDEKSYGSYEWITKRVIDHMNEEA